MKCNACSHQKEANETKRKKNYENSVKIVWYYFVRAQKNHNYNTHTRMYRYGFNISACNQFKNEWNECTQPKPNTDHFFIFLLVTRWSQTNKNARVWVDSSKYAYTPQYTHWSIQLPFSYSYRIFCAMWAYWRSALQLGTCVFILYMKKVLFFFGGKHWILFLITGLVQHVMTAFALMIVWCSCRCWCYYSLFIFFLFVSFGCCCCFLFGFH